MDIFGRMEIISTHGTSQGIIPRFYLQMLELAKMFSISDAENRVHRYWDFCGADFTTFYDLYHELSENHKQYIVGLKDRRFYNDNPKGLFHDRSLELIMERQVKDFFILSKQLLNNFSKSGIIDDPQFIAESIMFAKPGRFNQTREELTKNVLGINYEVMFGVMEHFRDNITIPLFELRSQFEHHNKKLDKFEIIENGLELDIIEPLLMGKPFIDTISFLYEGTLQYLEDLIVYFLALNTSLNHKGKFVLCEKASFDYSALRYRYHILPQILLQMGISGEIPLLFL